MKIQKPSVGRIVHVAFDTGVRPAVVIDVLEGSSVRVRDFSNLTAYVVQHNADGKPGTWRYPTQVKEEIEVGQACESALSTRL